MMIQKTMDTLEFHKVIAHVGQYAQTEMGKQWITRICPSDSYDEIVRLQEETDEALACFRLLGAPPFGGIGDVREVIKRIQIGSIASGVECRQIADVLYGTKKMKAYYEKYEGEDTLQFLSVYFEALQPIPELEKKLHSSVDDQGQIVDDASPGLRAIRVQLRSLENHVRDQLDGLLKNPNVQKMLSDILITVRNDRFVLPVKAEHRSYFGGVVHDASASGNTLFIEPERVVQLNHERSVLRLKEEREIERILRELTEEIKQYSHEIYVNVQELCILDGIFAKAHYSREMRCTKPILNQNGHIHLKKVGHPLIDLNTVVRNDLIFSSETAAVVITGPNTGGKTVLLKTLGLVVLMMQSGLQIPAAEGSILHVFRYVLADIGDEQSIEQSLSTFSSHMVNIVKILSVADETSLVLFDELGAGTDPQEGAALAIAILEEMKERKVKVFATTHYAELKMYAFETQGIENASMEFQVETLSPTYRLQLGIPGKSNAFEISKRLGLQDSILKRAGLQLSDETNRVETMIRALQKEKRRVERYRQRAAKATFEAEEIRLNLEQERAKLEAEKEVLRKKAQEEIQEEMMAVQKQAKEMIAQLQLMKQLGAEGFKEHELIEMQGKLNRVSKTLKKQVEVSSHAQIQVPKQLEAGDEVKVHSLNQKGTLVEKVGAKEWMVQIGIMKTKVPIHDLEKIQSNPVKRQVKVVSSVKSANRSVSTQLDLRGLRYEEAMHRLERFVDQALLSNYPRVTIIHGHGTGALRKGVQAYLKCHKRVKDFRLGGQGEGGLGVTIAQFQ